MTAPRPENGKSMPMEALSYSDKVYWYVFKLQTDALRAIPGEKKPGDSWKLGGKRTFGDEKTLKIIGDDIFRFMRTLSDYLPSESEGERHEHAYCLLYLLLKSASFVGSRAEMSFSQRTFFEEEFCTKGGKKSGEGRTRSAEQWKMKALRKAREAQTINPRSTQKELVNLV